MADKAIPWTEIKALSFDIYGTLVDWDAGMAEAFARTAVAAHVPDRAAALDDLRRRDRALQAERPRTLQRDVLSEGVRGLAADPELVADGKLTQAQIDASAAAYGSAIGDYAAFPDTVDAIRRLSKRYRLFPLTNVDNASWAGTAAHALAGCRFDAVYTAEDIGSYKPDLKNFHHLIDHLRSPDFAIDRDQLCHVAQSLYHDHAPAKRFGLPYHVWVDRKGSPGEVSDPGYADLDINLTVHTLGELADIVDAAFEKKA